MGYESIEVGVPVATGGLMPVRPSESMAVEWNADRHVSVRSRRESVVAGVLELLLGGFFPR